MRKLLLSLVVAALAAPAPALAAERTVSMKFNRFTPSLLNALTDDRVTWTNGDAVNHNVTPRTANFPGSGTIGPGASWAHVFSAPGTYRYVCTIHPGTMFGTIRVADIHLAGPLRALTHGTAARFTGLAPEGQSVAIVRVADGSEVGSTTPSAQGSFSIRVPMIRPGRYRATSAGRQSSAVEVSVRPRLTLKSRRAGKRLVLALAATPTQARAPVVVERQQRARWIRIARGRLNASSKATFRVARKAMKIRARTTRGVGGYSAATSRTIRVR